MRELGRTLSEEARKEIDDHRTAAEATRILLAAVKKARGIDNPCDTLKHFDYMTYMESASHQMCSPPGQYHTDYTVDTKFGRTYRPLDFVAVKYGKGQEVPAQILGIFTELDSDDVKITVRLHHGLDWTSPHGEYLITLSQDAPVIVTPNKLGRVLRVRIGEDKVVGAVSLDDVKFDEQGIPNNDVIQIHPEMLMEGWEHHEETEPIKLVEIKTDLERLALRDSFVKDSDALYYCMS
jgi:hypothetical protein